MKNKKIYIKWRAEQANMKPSQLIIILKELKLKVSECQCPESPLCRGFKIDDDLHPNCC